MMPIFNNGQNLDYGALAAAAAGFYAAAGNFVKGEGDTINIPEAAPNIGGNGKGFRLEEKVNFDPLAPGNNDGSFSSLTLGQDYYIYALSPVGSRIAKPLASIRSTYPDGSGATNSRKVSGFHVGRIRTMTQCFDAGAELSVGILPNGIWDLKNRPAVWPVPPGMVRVGNFAAFIYAASEDGTAWPNTIPLSKFNAVPLTGTEGYCYDDYIQLAKNAGLRLPTWQEFRQLAYGTPAGAIGGSNRVNTGYSDVFVSCHNIDMPSGHLWFPTADYFAISGGTWAWQTHHTGKDSAKNTGNLYLCNNDLRQALAGGSWADVSYAGAGCAFLDSAPWGVAIAVGLLCVCDWKTDN